MNGCSVRPRESYSSADTVTAVPSTRSGAEASLVRSFGSSGARTRGCATGAPATTDNYESLVAAQSTGSIVAREAAEIGHHGGTNVAELLRRRYRGATGPTKTPPIRTRRPAR